MILDECPGLENLKINGSRLPTFKQVLLCYLAHLNATRINDESRQQKLKSKLYKLVLNEVEIHYKKANIGMVLAHKTREKIENLYKE